jgi:hypothetical protein
MVCDGGVTNILARLLRHGASAASSDPVTIWKQLVAQLQPAPVEGATTGVFCGFLSGLHQKNPALAEAILDGAIVDDVLAQCYPALEAAIGKINERGLRRLLRSLELNKAPIHIYRMLEGGRVTDDLSGPDLKELLLRISGHTEGLDVAIEILYMRLSSGQGRLCPDEFVDIGCELMRRLNATGGKDSNLA